jgi:hypothetical protein
MIHDISALAVETRVRAADHLEKSLPSLSSNLFEPSSAGAVW